jgi:hypothetical protein
MTNAPQYGGEEARAYRVAGGGRSAVQETRRPLGQEVADEVAAANADDAPKTVTGFPEGHHLLALLLDKPRERPATATGLSDIGPVPQ